MIHLHSKEQGQRVTSFIGLIITLIFWLVSAPALAQQNFEGKWNSSFGELRLHKVGDYLIGDYSDRGVMAGKIEGDRVRGVFTNEARSGSFTFTFTGQRFQGTWQFEGSGSPGSWSGRREGSAPAQLNNFTRGGEATRTISNQRDVFDGTYDTNFGPVAMLARDLFLIGDYADRGVLIGMWDGNSFVGKFTNNGRVGWFDLAFLSRTGSFRDGKWGWIEGGGDGSWNFSRIDKTTPSIDNLIGGEQEDNVVEGPSELPAGLKAQLRSGGAAFGRFNARPPEDLSGTLCTDTVCTRQQPLSASRHLIWDNNTIPVCWENPLLENQQGRDWTKQAVTNTWAQESDVKFIGWNKCSRNTSGIRIRIEDIGPHVDRLGAALDGREGGMSLNFTFNNWSPTCRNRREDCIKMIAVHEFGHALGFAHEHNRSDRIEEGCDDAPQGTDGDWQVTSYDLESVMNYCNPQWNGNGRLSELDIKGLRRIYGSPDTISHSTNGLGHRGDGAALAIGDIDGNGISDAILLTDDDPSGQNQLRYKVLHDLDADGRPARIGASHRASGMGHNSDGAGATLADIDGNGRLDLLVMTYDAPDGANQFKYKIGYDLRADGSVRRWGGFNRVSGVGHSGEGAGLTVADIDGDGKLDLVLMAYDAPSGANEFRYKIGFGLKPDGSVTRWGVSERISGLGHSGDGAGIVISDIDNDGNLDMVLLAYDAPNGPNTYRYKVLWNIDNKGRPSRYGSWSRIMRGRGHSGEGAGMDVADLDGDGNLELIVLVYDAPDGQNNFRYDVIHDVF